MPSFPSPKPTVSYFDDLDFLKDFENEFPAIVYNDALTTKLDSSTGPVDIPQHIDEFDLKDETSLSEYDGEEQKVLYFNDLFPFNVIYPDDSKSNKDNDDDDDKIDINQPSRGAKAPLRRGLYVTKQTKALALGSKPIAPIFIRYDSVATLTKAYSQMYNEKSRHLGVRHSMIRELILNRVVSIEFVRSQQNLADHLTKRLARDLVIKSDEGMGLNGLKHMYLHIIPRMCLETAEKEDEVFTSQWPPRVTLGRLLSHARGLEFKHRRGDFPSGAKKKCGLSPKANVRVLHTAQLDVTFPENSFEVLKLLKNSVEVLKILENKLESMKILENKLESLKLQENQPVDGLVPLFIKKFTSESVFERLLKSKANKF
nr:zinc finger, CCHC-type [Tanacetum cinerariifolium]